MTWNCNCGRKWTGLAQAHCPTCHEHFSTVANFDRHRSSGHCQHPASLSTRAGAPVLKAAANRFGVTWVGAGEHPHASDAPGEAADPAIDGAA